MKFKLLIDKVSTYLWSTKNFTSINDIKKKCNLIIDLSKFIFYKNILNANVIIDYNQILDKLYSN